MEKTKILLVDDETAITDHLAPILERSGYVVAIAANGIEALREVSKFLPDIIILDIDMPELDGRSVLRQMRQEGNWTPIILLTQIGEAAERAMAINEGADDYLNKPYEIHELIARVNAVLRRAKLGQQELSVSRKLASGQVQLDRASRQVYLSGQELSLTPKAVSLLEHFMVHPEEVMTREQLLDSVWGWAYPAASRTVDTRVFELRSALNDDSTNPQYIETVAGTGYRFIGKVKVA